jgi:hypothetical protein
MSETTHLPARTLSSLTRQDCVDELGVGPMATLVVHRHSGIVLGAGVLLLIAGIAAHEWTISYFLQPATPPRVTARIHWWYISLNAWGAGLWLILRRRTIRGTAVAALLLLYAFLGSLLVIIDLKRAYSAAAPSDPRTVTGEYLVPDEQLGWALKPGGRARVAREGQYDVSYTIDPQGFRNTIPTSEVSTHVFVLGDSFAFGFGVNDDQTFSSRLAAHLRGQARVLNLGVEGHGLTQMLVRFRQVRRRVQPGDIVILTFIDDDLVRNWPDFMFVSRMLFGRNRLAHFPVFEDGTIRIENTDSHSNRLKALLVHAPWLGSLFGPLLLPPPAKAITDAAQMIEEVRAGTEARGAKFMLVRLPTRDTLRNESGGPDLSTFGAVVPISHRFPTYNESIDPLFLSHDDGHYSPEGHRLVGDILRAGLVERGWID